MRYITTGLFLFILGFAGHAQFGPQQIITEMANGVELVVAADINGDGDIDIISASRGSHTIAWQENLDGNGTFGPQNIVSATLDQTTYVNTADLDGDGDIDVFGNAPSIGYIAWFENLDGLGNFSSEIIITSNVDNPSEVHAADIDGDMDLDILCISRNDGKVSWYENLDGLGNFGPQLLISATAFNGLSTFPVDIDGDDDIDVIATVASEKRLYWYENLDGLGTFSSGHIIVETVIQGGFQSITAKDIDGDLDMDVVSVEFGGSTLSWYENLDGLGAFGPKLDITTNLETPYIVFASDLDDDGDADILSAATSSSDKVVWFENTNGLGAFGPEQLIDNELDGPRSVFAADLDNDGDNDVLSASISDDKIAWYENFTILGVEDFD